MSDCFVDILFNYINQDNFFLMKVLESIEIHNHLKKQSPGSVQGLTGGRSN